MTKTKLTLVLLYGGPSGEHEISLISAASVLAHLPAERYHIIPIGIDKQGRCFQNTLESLQSCKESLPVQTSTSHPLPSLFIDGRFVVPADVVFPMVHGPLLEDGALQGLLELAGVAYVGSGILGSAIGMDKDISRRLAGLEGIHSTRYLSLSARSFELEKKACYETIIQSWTFPLFVKPCCMGSSVGIHKVTRKEDLNTAMQDAFHFDDTLLIEEGVVGREIELAVLEHEQGLTPYVSLPGELKVNHPDGFYSYKAKYIEPEYTTPCIPAELSPAITQQLQTFAATLFTKLKCRGMARVDFFVNTEENKIYFNEINTLPGFTPISMYPALWNASGIPYNTLLEKLIQLALIHHQARTQLVKDYQ